VRLAVLIALATACGVPNEVDWPYGLDDPPSETVVQCTSSCCKMLWLEGEDTVKSIKCTPRACVCHDDTYAIYDCRGPKALTEEAVREVWEGGCCR
jgi:hypothetical protein